MSQTQRSTEPKVLNFQRNDRTASFIVEHGGLFFEVTNAHLAFEPVPEDAVLMCPTRETLDRIYYEQPFPSHTKSGIWQYNLLIRLCEDPALSFGAWQAEWMSKVQEGMALVGPDDAYGIYEGEKAHAEAWQSVAALLAPYVVRQRLNDTLAKLNLAAAIIALTKRELDPRAGSAYLSEADNGDDHVLLMADSVGYLKLLVDFRERHLELMSGILELKLSDGTIKVASLEEAFGSTVSIKLENIEQLIGATLQIV